MKVSAGQGQGVGVELLVSGCEGHGEAFAFSAPECPFWNRLLHAHSLLLKAEPGAGKYL